MLITKEIIKTNPKALSGLSLTLLSDKVFGQLYVNAFQDFAPTIKSDIASAAVTTTCTCKNRVSDYISNNIDKYSDFFINFFSSNNLLEKISELYYAYLANTPVNLSGKVAQTTVSEWENFTNKIKNHEFQSFSVAKEGDTVYVFFI
jgi:hypothetical protein